MKALQSLFGILIGLCLLAGLGAGAFILVRQGVALFATLDAPTATALGSAALIVLMGAWVMRRLGQLRAQRERARLLHSERRVLYPQLIGAWEGLFRAKRDSSEQAANEQLARLAETNPALILHGSSAVITAHVRLCQAFREFGLNDSQICLVYRQMVQAMRKDLGSEPMDLPQSDFLSCSLMDFEPGEANSIRVARP